MARFINGKWTWPGPCELLHFSRSVEKRLHWDLNQVRSEANDWGKRRKLSFIGVRMLFNMEVAEWKLNRWTQLETHQRGEIRFIELVFFFSRVFFSWPIGMLSVITFTSLAENGAANWRFSFVSSPDILRFVFVLSWTHVAVKFNDLITSCYANM